MKNIKHENEIIALRSKNSVIYMCVVHVQCTLCNVHYYMVDYDDEIVNRYTGFCVLYLHCVRFDILL